MQHYISLQILAIMISSFPARIIFSNLGGIWFRELQLTPSAAQLSIGTPVEKGVLLILGAALIVIVIYGAVAWRRVKS
jgi:hypothetical protein